ncbi:MAG: potassium transporter Kef [Caulobacter sp.]|nr:potassium transporter Kef [Caulobacter sp.]
MRLAEGLMLALIVSCLAVLVHYEALRWISAWVVDRPGASRVRVLTVIFGVLAAHAVEAGLFAVGFWLGADVLCFGRFVGRAPSDVFQYYSFALETYTTQSVGDLYPVGGLRLLASVEPLVGLILIGWSTTLTFMAMRRDWRSGGRRPAL